VKFGGMLRRATSTTIGLLGVILWVLGGLACLVWTLYVLFSIFGVWTIFVGLLLAPVTYVASIFIVWFSTGHFPVILLSSYVVSFIGLALASIGEKIKGEDVYFKPPTVVQMEKERKKQSNTLGIWSLATGIIGVFWWPEALGVAAVVLGVLQFRRHMSKCAIAGFTLGIVDIVLALVFQAQGLYHLGI